jgi:hypothetical protein
MRTTLGVFIDFFAAVRAGERGLFLLLALRTILVGVGVVVIVPIVIELVSINHGDSKVARLA